MGIFLYKFIIFANEYDYPQTKIHLHMPKLRFLTLIVLTILASFLAKAETSITSTTPGEREIKALTKSHYKSNHVELSTIYFPDADHLRFRIDIYDADGFNLSGNSGKVRFAKAGLYTVEIEGTYSEEFTFIFTLPACTSFKIDFSTLRKNGQRISTAEACRLLSTDNITELQYNTYDFAKLLPSPTASFFKKDLESICTLGSKEFGRKAISFANLFASAAPKASASNAAPAQVENTPASGITWLKLWEQLNEAAASKTFDLQSTGDWKDNSIINSKKEITQTISLYFNDNFIQWNKFGSGDERNSYRVKYFGDTLLLTRNMTTDKPADIKLRLVKFEKGNNGQSYLVIVENDKKAYVFRSH